MNLVNHTYPQSKCAYGQLLRISRIDPASVARAFKKRLNALIGTSMFFIINHDFALTMLIFINICCILLTLNFCLHPANFDLPLGAHKKFIPLLVSPWLSQQHMILMFTSRAIPRQAHITNVLKIILKNWNGHGMICMLPGTVSGGPVMTVIYKYLDCGDLHLGFARVRCEECGHEYLLAFSCKRRQFCPSCHQKRVVEYGEWLLTNVLKDVPHRQWARFI